MLQLPAVISALSHWATTRKIIPPSLGGTPRSAGEGDALQVQFSTAGLHWMNEVEESTKKNTLGMEKSR